MPKYLSDFIFDNRYRLIKKLGSGGFSEVWLAEDTKTNVQVALKVYAPEKGLDDDGKVVFQKEFALIHNQNHPHLLKPWHYDDFEDSPYLIMPYCANGSAFKLIGDTTEQQIARLMSNIASALAYLHDQDPPIIHQDIKPDNFMIDDKGNFLLSDFGISNKMRRTLTRSVARSNSSGTLPYMAPEKFSKKHQTIKASDIFSLGVAMYELLDGDLPFGEHGGLILNTGAEVPDIPEKFSRELNEIISACMAKDPWDRPTAQQLKECAKHFLKTGEWLVPAKVTEVDTTVPETAKTDVKQEPPPLYEQTASLPIETPIISGGRKTEKISYHTEDKIVESATINDQKAPIIPVKGSKRKRVAWGFLTIVVAVAVILIILIKTNLISFHTLTTHGMLDSNTVMLSKTDSINKARQDSINLALRNKRIQDSLRQKQIQDSINLAQNNGTVTDPEPDKEPNQNKVTSGQMTDARDGQTYRTVNIGGTTWMADNLNYDSYDSWCYDNEAANCRRFGRLYNWVSATSACPRGWHLPGDNDWLKLEKALDRDIRSGSAGWRGSLGGKSLLSGGSSNFNALLAGFGESRDNYDDKNLSTSFWTSSQDNSEESWKRMLKSGKNGIYRGTALKENRLSVRCIKN